MRDTERTLRSASAGFAPPCWSQRWHRLDGSPGRWALLPPEPAVAHHRGGRRGIGRESAIAVRGRVCVGQPSSCGIDGQNLDLSSFIR